MTNTSWIARDEQRHLSTHKWHLKYFRCSSCSKNNKRCADCMCPKVGKDDAECSQTILSQSKLMRRSKRTFKAENPILFFMCVFFFFFGDAVMGFTLSSSANVLPEGTSATLSVLSSGIHGNLLGIFSAGLGLNG